MPKYLFIRSYNEKDYVWLHIILQQRHPEMIMTSWLYITPYNIH